MSIEIHRKKPDGIVIDLAVDQLERTRGAKKSESKIQESLKDFLPRRDSTGMDDFNERERLLLKNELDHSRGAYKSLMGQYEELFSYCDILLKEANGKTKIAEEENGEIKNGLITIRNQLDAKILEVEEIQRKLDLSAKENIKYQTVISEKSAEIEKAIATLSQQEKQTAEMKEKLSQAQSQEAWLKEQTHRLDAQVVSQKRAIERTLSALNETMRNVDSICLTVVQYFDRISTAGENSLTPKAGKMLAEQLKIEINNLRRIQSILLEPRAETRIETPPPRFNI
jgi:chromosome segregation ATPase